jgi:hypothetical protein
MHELIDEQRQMDMAQQYSDRRIMVMIEQDCIANNYRQHQSYIRLSI